MKNILKHSRQLQRISIDSLPLSKIILLSVCITSPVTTLLNPSLNSHLCTAMMHALVSRHRGRCKCRSTCLEALRCALIRHRVNEAVDLHPLPNERVSRKESRGRKVEAGHSRGISHSGPSHLASLVKEFLVEKNAVYHCADGPCAETS